MSGGLDDMLFFGIVGVALDPPQPAQQTQA